jgi:hypothetical protein
MKNLYIIKVEIDYEESKIIKEVATCYAAAITSAIIDLQGLIDLGDVVSFSLVEKIPDII